MENEDQQPKTFKEWLTNHELVIAVGVDKEDGEYYAYTDAGSGSPTFSGNQLDEVFQEVVIYVAGLLGYTE